MNPLAPLSWQLCQHSTSHRVCCTVNAPMLSTSGAWYAGASGRVVLLPCAWPQPPPLPRAPTCVALFYSRPLVNKQWDFFPELGRHVQWGGQKVQRCKKKQLLLSHNSQKDPRVIIACAPEMDGYVHRHLCALPCPCMPSVPSVVKSALCDGACVCLCLCCGQNFSWWRRSWTKYNGRSTGCSGCA